MADLIDRARAAVNDRADLPGMSLMEHLEELRRRIIRSALFLIIAFFIAFAFSKKIYVYVQAPMTAALIAHHLDPQLVVHNPIDPVNLYLKVSFFGGAILAAPFILYQVWMFISPGLYQNEKRYMMPFMASTVGLFLAGAFFGYRFVFPGLLEFLVGYADKFKLLIEINEYTDLFTKVILGLGITFELPILIMFLAMFGIVSASLLWKNVRYAILAIFIVAAIITPTPDVLTMCVFAAPMVVLYFISIGVAYMVHPDHRKKKAEQA